MIEGHIYLVNMADLKNNIYYKIGKSINVDKRLKSYDYANIVSIMKSDNIDFDESKLIKIFKKNCKLDKGKEFFKAESDEFILQLFLEYFLNKIKIKNETVNTDIVNTEVISTEIISKEIISTEVISTEVTNTEVISTEIVAKDIIICPNIICKKEFKFISLLKKHLINSYHCSKNIDDIDEYILNEKHKSIKIIKNIKCIKCNITYTRQSSLNRHLNNSNCNNDNKKHKLLLEIKNIKYQISKIK